MKNKKAKVKLSALEVLEEYKKKYFFNSPSIKTVQFLPRTVMYEIFSHFSTCSLIKLALVCRHWYLCSRDNLLWKRPDLSGFRFNSFPHLLLMLQDLFPYNVFGAPLPIKHMEMRPNRELAKISNFNNQFVYFCTLLAKLETLVLPKVGRVTNSINDQMLNIVSLRCVNLKKIDMTMHKAVTDRGIESLSKNCRNLTSLQMDFNPSVTIRTVILLLKNCPKLRMLSTTFCTMCNLSSKEISEFVKHANKLLYLGIQVNDILYEKSESDLFCSLSELRKLFLRNWYVKYGFRVSELFSTLTKLRDCEIHFHPKSILQGVKISNPCLEKLSFVEGSVIHQMLISNCINLHSIHFQQIKVIERLKCINCNNLRSIHIKSCRLEDFDLSSFVNDEINENLELIDLFDCAGIESLEITESLTKLKKLKLYNCNDLDYVSVSNESLVDLDIDLCMSIEVMSLNVPNVSICKLFRIPHEMMPMLSKLSMKSNKLENLNLQRCSNLEELTCIAPKMTALNLMGCKQIKLNEFAVVCPKLKKFALSLPLPTQVMDDKFIMSLTESMPDVSMLFLGNQAQMTGRELFMLCSKFSKLRALILRNCSNLINIKVIGNALVGIEITNAEKLKNCKIICRNLRKLEIKNCPHIDKESIPFVKKNCPRLVSIKIQQQKTKR